MGQIEADAAIVQILPFVQTEARVLVGRTEIPAAPPDVHRALGERRSEAIGAAGVRAQRLVERIAETAGRRPQRQSSGLENFDRLIERNGVSD